MTDQIDHIVLVGGGLAAAKAAETVRAEGYNGQLALITEEPRRPYERPPLSKAVLTGDEAPDTVYVHSRDYYAEHDIELVTDDPVTDIDRDAAKVTTRSGRTLGFDRLVLATGASPRELPRVEPALGGIATLRTLDDSRHLSEQLRAVDHVTIVGAGWIGCEVAAAARKLGTAVTLVDPLETPLERVLGPEVGDIFARLHRDHDVDLRTGVSVTDVRGSERVEQVTLSDGSTVVTGLVVVGIGVVPRVELAEACGLEVDDGIVVDATLATDSDPRIFAAGDVASAWHPRYQRHLRVEHWANALNQGQIVGRNLLGAGEAYDRLPYFYTDQYDLGMEYVGLGSGDDRVVFRGDPEALEFIAFWLADGRVSAAMNVNVWDVVDDLKALIAADHAIDTDRLGDADVPLTDLIPT